MLGRDELAAGFVEQARKAAEDALPEARWDALRQDADALGLFGLLAALAEPAPVVDPTIRAELVGPIDRDLKDALGDSDDVDLPVRFERFLKAKGARGPEQLALGTSRVIHEVYDLRQHRLGQEDALAACDLLAWGGPGADARETAKRLARISRQASRVVLGHLSEQLELVHSLGQDEQVTWLQVDGRMHEFAPRIFAQRLPSMIRFLVADEPRLRFAFVLWARLRGVTLTRAGVQSIATHIAPDKPMQLIQALEARSDARAALRAADAAWPVAGAIERVFLGRRLDLPKRA